MSFEQGFCSSCPLCRRVFNNTLLKKLRPHAVSSRLFLLDPIVRDFCGRYLRRTGGTMFELGLLATCWYCDANHCLKLEE